MPWWSSGYDARLECRDWGSIPHWGTEFLDRQNPLLHFAPNYGIHWSICISQSVRTHFPQRGWMWQQTKQMPWWSSSYDARPECRDWGLIPHWGTEFLDRQNPLLHFAPNYGIHWSICISQSVRTHFPQRGWMWQRTKQMPWWSSSYDALPECERPGFDPPLRH